MSDVHDELLSGLAAADPASVDPPPEPGSVVYTRIEDRIMTIQTSARRGRKTGVRVAAPLAMTAAAAALAATVLVGPANDPSVANAAATVRDASRATADVTSFRATVERSGAGGRQVYHGAFDGQDVSLEQPGGTRLVILNGRQWDTADPGPTRSRPVPDGERFPSLTRASDAVLRAAVGGRVTPTGTDTIRGARARRYTVVLDRAARRRLSGTRDEDRALFDLEEPEHVESIDVWVGDGLIRRLRVTPTDPRAAPATTTDFYDFGTRIQIVPPR